MLGNVPTDDKGKPKLDDSIRVSDYQPSQEVVDLTNLVKKDYQLGHNIQHNPYEEFNNNTFISRLNIDQRNYNAHSPADSAEPDEAW